MDDVPLTDAIKNLARQAGLNYMLDPKIGYGQPGPDGKPIMVSPVKEREVMSVEDCSRRIVTAIERREREVIMTARGRLGMWLKLIAPSLVDRIAKRAIETGR